MAQYPNKALALAKKVIPALWKIIFYPFEQKYRRQMREDPGRYLYELFTNPVILAQAESEMIIQPDWELGHRLPPGADFIGRDRFLGFNEVVEKVKTENRRLIISLGDSSTSGWDSNVVKSNRRRRKEGRELLSPFFRYRTYSDNLQNYLEEAFPGRYKVVNAGVPAYSSFQGYRRLRQLLENFTQAGVVVEVVTIYFGNNDCAWNANYEDYAIMPRTTSWWGKDLVKEIYEQSMFAKIMLARRARYRASPHRTRRVRTRVAVRDYKENLRRMIHLCRRYGCQPLLIEPVIPLYWKPGMRVKGEELELQRFSESQVEAEVLGKLEAANSIWRMAKKLARKGGMEETVSAYLEEARENDLITPRIKRNYRRQLQLLALEENVPLVRVDIPQQEDDSRFFVDYCHPIGQANEWLATAIAKEVADLQQKTKTSFAFVESVESDRQRLPAAVSFMAALASLSRRRRSWRRKSHDRPLPDSIYTLY